MEVGEKKIIHVAFYKMQNCKVTFLYTVYVFKKREMKIDLLHFPSLYLLQVTHQNGCMISICIRFLQMNQ